MFFVRAGTIHAIGGGALVTEIQESSNLTYRLYDYDRVDKTGKKRPLHVDKALAVGGPESPRPAHPAHAGAELPPGLRLRAAWAAANTLRYTACC